MGPAPRQRNDKKNADEQIGQAERMPRYIGNHYYL